MRWCGSGLFLCVTLAVAAPIEPTALDRKLCDSLRELHNLGAEQYNQGDPTACYHTYRSALLTIKPLLDHRPTVQTLLAQGLLDAEQASSVARKAFELHSLIEKVRAELKKEAPAKPPAETTEPPPAPKPKPTPTAEPAPTTIEVAPPPRWIERVPVAPQPVERAPAPRPDP